MGCAGAYYIGVAANDAVRFEVDALARAAGVAAVFPPPTHCTDNGVMVAWAALEAARLHGGAVEAAAASNLEVRNRWPIAALSPNIERAI